MKIDHNGKVLHLKQQLEQHFESKDEIDGTDSSIDSAWQQRCPAQLGDIDIVQPLLNHSNDGIIVMDRIGELVWYSDQLISVFTLSGDIAFENLLSSLPVPIEGLIRDYSVSHGTDEGVGTTDGVDVYNFELRTSSSAYNLVKGFEGGRNVRVCCFPLMVSGELYGSGFIISDQTQAVMSQRDSELAIEVFSECEQAILITDNQHVITFANRAFSDISGYDIEEVVGQHVSLFFDSDDNSYFGRQQLIHLARDHHWEGEIQSISKERQRYQQWVNISAYPKLSDSPSNYIVTFQDVTKSKLREKRIEKLAYYDTLTGCGNRLAMGEFLSQLIQSSQSKGEPTSFALLFIDIDGFKLINDTYGHDIGDKVLKYLARRINGVTRRNDRLFRIGGDEFILILIDAEIGVTQSKAQQVIDVVKRPFQVDRNAIATSISISISIGIVNYPEDGQELNSLLKHADAAMYKAKSVGKGTFEYCDPELLKKFGREFRIKKQLYTALHNQELQLHFMPQVSMSSGEVVSVEALLRWTNPEFGALSPAEFIPIAERSGMIHEFTRWVIENVSQSLHTLSQSGAKLIPCSINISAADFSNANVFNSLIELIKNGYPQHITLEITETLLVEDREGTLNKLLKLKDIGVSISLDDFGTGFSSMSYLTDFPIDEIKIDKRFADNLLHSKRSQDIYHALIQLSNSLGCRCVAEGVESKEQFEWLKSNSCDVSQGFLHYKPMPLNELVKLLKSGL
jgi:diguanylate cyclase (GGDEF)-like protein/PAS domain S-box-containing protein